MSQPMTPLERRLLFPDPKKIDKTKLAEMEANRCGVCGGVKGHWGGLLDMACQCPKPEPEPERRIKYPYIPVPPFNFEPWKPLYNE